MLLRALTQSANILTPRAISSVLIVAGGHNLILVPPAAAFNISPLATHSAANLAAVNDLVMDLGLSTAASNTPSPLTDKICSSFSSAISFFKRAPFSVACSEIFSSIKISKAATAAKLLVGWLP